MEISQGTMTGGLKRLAPLFESVYDEIVTENQHATHWHADETRWPDHGNYQRTEKTPKNLYGLSNRHVSFRG